MKKVVGILAMLVSTVSFSQEKIGEYASSYFKGKTFKIEASKPKPSGKFSYYIDVYSIDTSVKKIALVMDNKEAEKFKNCLTDTVPQFV